MVKIVGDWTQLQEEIQVPADLVPALAANRVEMLMLARRAMNAEEVGQLLNVLRVLMNTNAALQQRCSLLHEMLSEVRTQVKGLGTTVGKIEAELLGASEEDDESEES
jgi:hypothetical protein